MARIFTAALAAGLALVPMAASAQDPPAPPGTELGAQVSMQTGQQGGLTWTPRVSLSLLPLTSLDITADIRPPHGDAFDTRRSSQSIGLHVRQTLWSRGRWQVFGVVGAGGEHTTTFFPGRTIEGRDGPVTFAPSEFSETGLAVHIGPAVQVEVSPRLALRADLRTTLSQEGGLRAMVGAIVPLGGRFQADSTRANPRAGHDSLTNGIAIGAGTGALVSAGFAAFMMTVFCDQGDDCLAATTGAVIVASVAGAGLGGVVGAVVDSLIIRAKPGGGSASIGVRWR